MCPSAEPCPRQTSLHPRPTSATTVGALFRHSAGGSANNWHAAMNEPAVRVFPVRLRQPIAAHSSADPPFLHPPSASVRSRRVPVAAIPTLPRPPPPPDATVPAEVPKLSRPTGCDIADIPCGCVFAMTHHQLPAALTAGRLPEQVRHRSAADSKYNCMPATDGRRNAAPESQYGSLRH